MSPDACNIFDSGAYIRIKNGPETAVRRVAWCFLELAQYHAIEVVDVTDLF
jgi:hypothetical protein